MFFDGDSGDKIPAAASAAVKSSAFVDGFEGDAVAQGSPSSSQRRRSRHSKV